MLKKLFSHNDWANDKLLPLCEGLTDEQLDADRPMGFGSLRATLFHMWAAERLWLDRWLGKPWAPLNTQANISLEQLTADLKSVAAERNELINVERATNFDRVVEYKNTEEHTFAHRIGDLLLHVANHATHHRAQALNYLKQFERTVPGGLDYIFYKLAFPTLEQTPDAIEAMREAGLDTVTGNGLQVEFNVAEIQSYYAYSDWATDQIVTAATDIDESLLDRDFNMGPGTFRKTLLHTVVAEEWWYRNWTEDPSEFPSFDEAIPLVEIAERLARLREQRNELVSNLDEGSAGRPIPVSFGTPPISFRVIESMVQLCSHGTHHRAQLLNMLRQFGATTPAIDYVVWMRTND